MKYIVLNLLVILMILWGSAILAQSNIKVGGQAPEVNITQWLANTPKDTNLDGKFLIIDFWGTWCIPCLEAVPHFNSLVEEFSNDEVVFLSMTNESPKTVQRVLDKMVFLSSVVTDENNATQIAFGNGLSDLDYYPLIVLIDDNNIIQWYGSSSDLSREDVSDFLDRKTIELMPFDFSHPDHIEEDLELTMFKELDLKWWTDMLQSEKVTKLVKIQEWPGEVEKCPSVSASFGGYWGRELLNDLLMAIFPKRRFVISEGLKEKYFRLAYIDKLLNSSSKDFILNEIITQLNCTVKKEMQSGLSYELKVKDKSQLIEGTKKVLPGHEWDEKNQLIFDKTTLLNLSVALSGNSNDYWLYRGRNKKKYDFEVKMDSLETIIKSLACYGIEIEAHEREIEVVYLSEKED